MLKYIAVAATAVAGVAYVLLLNSRNNEIQAKGNDTEQKTQKRRDPPLHMHQVAQKASLSMAERKEDKAVSGGETQRFSHGRGGVAGQERRNYASDTNKKKKNKKKKKEKAKLPPLIVGEGEEKVYYSTFYDDNKARRYFGRFECQYCGRWWYSARTWIVKEKEYCQECHGCKKFAMPVCVYSLKVGEGDENKPHNSSGCEMCIEIGRSTPGATCNNL